MNETSANVLTCPKCAGALVGKAGQSVPFDECPSCGGMWFDYYSLQALFSEQTRTSQAGRVEEFMSLPESSPSSLSCPVCHTELLTTDKSGICVEWCRGCKGIHLDKGELEKMSAWKKGKRAALHRDTAMAAASFVGGIGQLVVEELFGITFRTRKSDTTRP